MLPNLAGLQSVFNVGTVVPVSITGDTVERELARFTLPAGHVLGSAGFLRLTAFVAETVNGNAKTLRFRHASVVGQNLAGAALTINQAGQNVGWFGLVRDPFPASAAALRCVQSLNGYAWSSAAIVNLPLDFEQDQVFVLTGQLGVGTDTLTLEAAFLEGYKF